MNDDKGIIEVADVAELRSILGLVNPRAADKDRPDLHPMQARWIEASPFCLVATSDSQGRCDVSPKGDPAGFCKVLGPLQLVIPERPGNRRADGFHNVLTNGQVGLIFLIPGRPQTLRVNGRARVVRDAPFFEDLIVDGHRPTLALLVDVEQVFFHCSKAFLRSNLWDHETWNANAVPSHAEISHALKPGGMSLAELETYYGANYAADLYREPDPK